MQIAVVSLFPEMFEAISRHGITSRAINRGLLELTIVNPREFATDRHRTVDDRPYGGGPGMVGTVPPWRDAIHAARIAVQNAVSSRLSGDLPLRVKTVYLSPQGRPLDYVKVREIAHEPGLVMVAGRYEGLDERLIQTEIDEEISIGDYVLSGGELAAMIVIDSVTRQLPGALGHEDSAEQDSFESGLLDCPHYTRPEQIDGLSVPPVLLSGDHNAIEQWRQKQALGNTWIKRPDLIKGKKLTDQQQRLLAEFISEFQQSDK